jgi:hypothetical protein
MKLSTNTPATPLTAAREPDESLPNSERRSFLGGLVAMSAALPLGLIACTVEENAEQTDVEAGEGGADEGGAAGGGGLEQPDGPEKQGAAESFGAALSLDAEFVDFDALLATPEAYAGRTIQTEGIVRQVCQKRGCWMELRSPLETASAGVTVRFLDYGFFVPLDSRGALVRVEGIASVTVLSAEEVEELVAEGYSVGEVREDGTSVVLGFIASGVQMWNRNL